MTPQEDILGKLEEHASSLSESFSVRRIGLFGSFLHGRADDSSDVDILVEFDEPGFDNYMDLKFFLEKLFSRPVDLVMADSLKPRIQPAILKEVVYAKGL